MTRTLPRRPFTRSGAALAALVAAGLALSGCTADTPEPSESGAVDADASVAIRLVLEPGNLDIRETAGSALDQILIDNVYQGLVGRTTDQEIVPVLASDYEVAPDGLTYRFTVRDDVVFHDGQPLTPEDVAWSLRTRQDSDTWADADRLATIDDIAVDGQDVVLTLPEPDSTLLWNLTGRAGIVLKEGDDVDYATAANGTGPFQLERWLQGDSIAFVRSEEYWGEPAGVSEVIFDYIPDPQAALNAATSGEVDVVTGFDANLTDQIESSGDFTVEIGASTDKGTLAMNSERPGLDDQRVRQAIRQAIDHDAIVEALGAGETMYGPIPSLDPGYEDLSSIAPYDPAAAEALLAEANAENLELTLTIPNHYPSIISQILVSDLNEVGITLTVQPVEFPTWINDVYVGGDYDLSFVLHTEARDFENWADPTYYFGYDNPTVQQLYSDALHATDDATSEELLKQAARIVSEDAAADWLYNGASVVAVAGSIQGMPTTNVNERLNLAELTKSDG